MNCQLEYRFQYPRVRRTHSGEMRLSKRGRNIKSQILLRVVRKSSSLYLNDISSYYGKCHYMGTQSHLTKGLNIYLPLNKQRRKKKFDFQRDR